MSETEETKPSPAPEEPKKSSPLTEAFSDKEQEALNAFRSQITDVLVSAYPDKADAKTSAITLWGVTIDPHKLYDARTSVILMKFLRARNLSVEEAKTMLISTLRWREEFNVEAACKEEFPKDVFGQMGHIYGKDKRGRPVVYNIYGGSQDLKEIFKDVDRFLRWRVAFMEQSMELLDFETVDQMIQVHDYAGVSMSSRDANSKKAASEASSIFSNYYPEVLHKKYFINVPSYMSWIFWLFKPLMPAATLAKMSVVGSGRSTIGKALLPEIDAKELPKQYGGEAEAF